MSDRDRILQLFVAIFNEGDGFKHWGLWLEDSFADHDDSFLLNARGESGRFRYELERTNARSDGRKEKLILVAQLYGSQVPELKDIAAGMEIKDWDPSWNCQSYVVELIQRLRDERLIEVTQKRYEKIRTLQEGLVPAE